MEKELQINHIKSILSLVFQEEAENFLITLFEESSAIPNLIDLSLEIEFDTLILLKNNSKSPFLESKVKKLSNLLSKKIIQITANDCTYLYWVEGLRGNAKVSETKKILVKHENIENMKSSTRLPKWLDKYVFEDLLAKYEPDFEKFDYNLEHSIDDLLVYLGTYFPRSYAEAFCIYEDLFLNQIIGKENKQKEELNILDIGCGTGGNLLGLLIAVKKEFSDISKINV